ncbi:MAG: hypothetical protein AVDCRST_MAG77-5838, partial [uncultured Chloroflexi bacterium]
RRLPSGDRRVRGPGGSHGPERGAPGARPAVRHGGQRPRGVRAGGAVAPARLRALRAPLPAPGGV